MDNFNLKIDFHDPVIEKPDDQEIVLIVLKPSIAAGHSHFCNNVVTKTNSDGQRIISALAKVYKTVPTRFTYKGPYYTYSFTEDEIVCWGRINSD